MNKDLKFDFRAVIYREGAVWLAHCLELDLVAEGTTAEQAVDDLVDLVALQVDVALAECQLESIFRFAPPEVWSMYYAARKRRSHKRLRKPVERFEARELVLA